MKRPRRGMPSGSIRTSYALAISLLKSDNKGYDNLPKPPCYKLYFILIKNKNNNHIRGFLIIKMVLTFRGVLINAKCEKCESHEQPTIFTSIFLNSSI